MLSVLWEIIIPLLIAFAVGLLTGWLLWRWRRTRVTGTEWDELTSMADANRSGIIDLRDQRDQLGRELELTRGRLDTTGAEMERLSTLTVESRSVMDSLESDLGVATEKVTELDSGLATARARIADLEGELAASEARRAELEGDLGKAANRSADTEEGMGAAAARIAQLEGELVTARGRTGELEGELGAVVARSGQLEIDVDQADKRVAMLTSDLDTATGRVAELESEIEGLRADMEAAAVAPAVESVAAVLFTDLGTDWHEGTTALGTPGSDHADDLQAVSGIGPKLEELLNGFGVRSWEQLAALDDADVAKIDAALEDFPGRIQRDQWVEQARAFMANGHEPVDWSVARPTPSWAQGTTSLGTYGAGHTDDLKVINGVGPTMEGVLNDFGITAWEQVAALNSDEVERVGEAIEAFPGRIERDRWVEQARELVDRFPEVDSRPTRETFLEASGDEDPWS